MIRREEKGFTIVEIALASVIFPIVVIGIANAFLTVTKQYRVSRQLTEIYSVLSACPELDRALEFSSLTTGTNCYPNNSFKVEGVSTALSTYSPTLTVTDTSSLPTTDALYSVPNSKVVRVGVGYNIDTNGTPLVLRLLITRNGVAQQ